MSSLKKRVPPYTAERSETVVTSNRNVSGTTLLCGGFIDRYYFSRRTANLEKRLEDLVLRLYLRVETFIRRRKEKKNVKRRGLTF